MAQKASFFFFGKSKSLASEGQKSGIYQEYARKHNLLNSGTGIRSTKTRTDSDCPAIQKANKDMPTESQREKIKSDHFKFPDKQEDSPFEASERKGTPAGENHTYYSVKGG